MHKKLFDALYLLNIISQAAFTLLFPIGLGVLAAFLLTKYAGAPSVIYAVLIILGVFVGLFSMVKFVLSATKSLERLEAQREKARIENERNEKDEK